MDIQLFARSQFVIATWEGSDSRSCSAITFAHTLSCQKIKSASALVFLHAGSGRFLSPPKGACMLGTRLYNTDSQFWVDHCTRCSCDNSVITCSKETCPVLECPRELQMTLPGRCCPQCSLVEESKASCSYGGRTYKASIPLLFVVVQFYAPRAGNAITDIYCAAREARNRTGEVREKREQYRDLCE